ncbi:hypothetical protein DLJ54_05510 [Corynebacterium heidelbergense]|uniref:ComF family protein n=2 Tax=Corynebacterium heidelbergense TaxID=2055947 RepID=A0A364V5Q5_9CORY|nr:hypothetical protein DLJ54_05510 [Corynebacterium heidelbergense]
MGSLWQAAAGLLWRTDCVCCGRIVEWGPGEGLCEWCACRLAAAPRRVFAPTMPIPIYACGPYGGAHRMLVLAAKERLRAEAAEIMGRMYLGALDYLAAGGLVPSARQEPVVLVPAPTRRSSARARGGDVVTRAAGACAALAPRVAVVPAGRLAEKAVDSVGLSRAQRRENVARNLLVDAKAARELRRLVRGGASVIAVDDVATTTATLGQFCLHLAARGVRVRAGLVIAAA